MSRYQRVGDWLVERGVITEADRDRAIEVQKQTNSRFGEVLVSLGIISEEKIVDCLAEQYDLPRANLNEIQPTQTALRLVSPTFALSRLILPVMVTDHEFHCVICDPLDITGTDYLTKALGKRLIISLAGATEIFEAIAKNYAIPSAKKSPEPQEATAPATSEKPDSKPKAKSTRAPRPVKVDRQSGRDELLTAMAACGTDLLWETYGD